VVSLEFAVPGGSVTSVPAVRRIYTRIPHQNNSKIRYGDFALRQQAAAHCWLYPAQPLPDDGGLAGLQ
ncbi:hypothetical protein, partial [Acidithiobacillus ferriphilus]|uniref:hypothetical protein n=1 Tax=Acidithiobacillus ferriphilus TaxID=1689834 RepID=UPI002DB7E676